MNFCYTDISGISQKSDCDICSTVNGNQALALLLLFFYIQTKIRKMTSRKKVTAVHDSGLGKNHKLVAEAQFFHQISDAV